MSPFEGKTYWLIGASEGLGREIAKGLALAGAHVIVSARSKSRLLELANDLGSATALPMDVTCPKSVMYTAQAVGRVDGVIYNAGVYEPMHTQDWDVKAAISMLDVNFAGALRVLHHIMPQLIADDKGDVTLVGSLAGYRGLPAAIGYGASKAALISLAETMRYDLRNSGVTVRIVNPGFIKTRLTDKNSFVMPQLMKPEKAASHVLKAMEHRRFRTDFPRPFSWLIKAMQLLPDWVVYRGK